MPSFFTMAHQEYKAKNRIGRFETGCTVLNAIVDPKCRIEAEPGYHSGENI
jgi:hypothetical protein